MAIIATSLGNPRFQATDTNGLPLAGGKLYTYTAGTSLAAPTYSDPQGTVANTNPVVLDSYGGAIVRGVGSYKFVLKDASDNTLWTMDYIFMANLQDVIPADAAVSAGRASVSAAAALVSQHAASVSATAALSYKQASSASAASALSSANTATSAAGTATTQAGTATSAAGTATTQAGTATTQAGIATTQAGLAATSETNAAASAVTAAAQAARMTGTSVTSLAISIASKSFTTQAGKFFDVGTFLNITSDASPTTNAMYGQVTGYSGTSLTVNVTNILGSGTHTDWTIHAAGAGPVGATGPGSGDMLKADNLSGLASYPTARMNLGLKGGATASVGSSAGTVCAGDDARLTNSRKCDNTFDTAATARTNLGLKGAATCSVGSSAGTVCAGDDARLTNARQCNNTFASSSASRSALGLGALAVKSTASAGDVSFAATARVLGRNTAGAGTGEEVTLSQLLDFIGSAAGGDILYRGASNWARLAKGADTNVLTLASGLPSWAAPAASGEWAYVSKNTSSGVASKIFTGLDEAYDHKFILRGMDPATDNAYLTVVTGYGAGPTYRAQDYGWAINVLNSAGTASTIVNQAAGAAAAQISPALASDSNPGMDMELVMTWNASLYYVTMDLRGSQTIANTNPTVVSFYGRVANYTNGLTAMKFLASSGNISGTIECWRRARQ